MSNKKYLYITVSLVLFLAAVFFSIRSCLGSGLSLGEDKRMEVTPDVLDSIHSIGEWQLLTVPLTVEVDTVQSSWMGLVRDRLRRSYTGTLSLGINLHSLPDEWSSVDGDTITLTVPDVCLLDSDFIDESKTRVILSESNRFEASPKVKGAMLRKARRQMIQVGVVPSNTAKCRQKATSELTRCFTAIGYKKVNIVFK